MRSVQRPGAAATGRPLRDCTVVMTPRSSGMHAPGLRHELERSVGEARGHPGPPGDLLAVLAGRRPRFPVSAGRPQ